MDGQPCRDRQRKKTIRTAVNGRVLDVRSGGVGSGGEGSGGGGSGGGRRRLSSGNVEESDLIDGGAIYLKQLKSHITFEEVVFRGNSANGNGGAICVKDANGYELKFVNVIFIHN